MFISHIQSNQSNQSPQIQTYQLQQHSQFYHPQQYHQSQQLNIQQNEKLYSVQLNHQLSQLKQTPLFNIDRRPYLNIQSDTTNDQKYSIVKNGHARQTNGLNRHLKTKIKQFLDIQVQTHNLKHDQKLRQYLSGKQSFTNTRILFGMSQHDGQEIKQDVQCDKLRILYQKYFRSIHSLKSMMKAKNNFCQKVVHTYDSSTTIEIQQLEDIMIKSIYKFIYTIYAFMILIILIITDS